MSLLVLGGTAIAASIGAFGLRWLIPVALFAAGLSPLWCCAAVNAVLAVTVWEQLTHARRRRRRAQRLPEFADAVARRLERGESVDVALAGAINEVPGATHAAVDSVAAQLGRGRILDWSEIERAPSESVLLAATWLAGDDPSQGADVMRSAAAVARARRLRRLDVEAQAAGARASSVVIAAIPWCAALLSWLTGDLSLGGQAGHLVLGALLSLSGVCWSLRLVSAVEVDA